jgi:hypothetical protein
MAPDAKIPVDKELWQISINSVPKAIRTLKAIIKLRCHIKYWTKHEQSVTDTEHKHAYTTRIK